MHPNDFTDNAAVVKTESGWREVGSGLKLVVLGYLALIAALLCVLGLGHIAGGSPVVGPTGLTLRDKENLFGLSALILGVGAILGYGLILAGQWRCLMYVPPHLDIKEMIYVCLVCILLGSGLLLASVFVEDGRVYQVLWRSLGDLRDLDFTSLGGLLVLAGTTTCLLNFFLFNTFLQTVGNCLADRRRRVDLFLVGMSLLLGGTVGSLVYVHHLAFKAQVLTGLGVGWGCCFLWHLGRVAAVRRRIHQVLSRVGPQEVTTGGRLNSQGVPQVLSGVRRCLRAMEQG